MNFFVTDKCVRGVFESFLTFDYPNNIHCINHISKPRCLEFGRDRVSENITSSALYISCGLVISQWVYSAGIVAYTTEVPTVTTVVMHKQSRHDNFLYVLIDIYHRRCGNTLLNLVLKHMKITVTIVYMNIFNLSYTAGFRFNIFHLVQN
jgi:hypothetical protein